MKMKKKISPKLTMILTLKFVIIAMSMQLIRQMSKMPKTCLMLKTASNKAIEINLITKKIQTLTENKRERKLEKTKKQWEVPFDSFLVS